jgi:hypothetical protein
VTVSPAAASAIWAAAARAYQGVALGTAPFDAGNSLLTIAQAPSVAAALAGGSNLATSVAQMVATGDIASVARLAHVRYFDPDTIRNWE